MARDPEREARRQARRERSLQAAADEIAAREAARRIRHKLTHEFGVPPEDIVKLDAEGYVGKHAHTTGELAIPVTPPEQNGEHDPATTTD